MQSFPTATILSRKWMLEREVTKPVVLPGRVTMTNPCASGHSVTPAGCGTLAWESRRAGRAGVFHTELAAFVCLLSCL